MIKVIDQTEEAKGKSVYDNMAMGEKMSIGLVQERGNRGETRFFIGVLMEEGIGVGIPMTIQDARALIDRMTLILDRHEHGEI